MILPISDALRAIVVAAVVFTGMSSPAAPRTDGWENVNPERREFPAAELLWQSSGAVSWAMVGGAEGAVTTSNGWICVEHANDEGYVLVRGEKFAVTKGRTVRFFADVEVPDADDAYSLGFLRVERPDGDLSADSAAENQNFFYGGRFIMRQLPCSPVGQTYRKYYQHRAESDELAPAIVVAGRRSISRWRNWSAEDVAAAQRLWQTYYRAHEGRDHQGERLAEAVFDAQLKADPVDHTAEIRRVNGVSRLFVDGELAAPVAYKARHRWTSDGERETFAGRRFDGSDVRLMISDVRLGGVPARPGHWTSAGFDVKAAVRQVKNQMRLAPNSLFLLAIGCTAYPDFIEKEHPEEAWRNRDGTPVMGDGGSCVATYSSNGMIDPKALKWMWPSYASCVWQAGVERCIGELVAELKTQGLSKRIVGIHTHGYHDGQFTAPYTDWSAPARVAYAEYLTEPNLISTNYAFFAKQLGFRAQERFARAFKQALGKPAIAVRWCESPLALKRSGALDITSFCRSDVMDVIVTQPNYMQRLPAMPTPCSLPADSFNLHGKMLWNEFDLRTWNACESWASSCVSTKGLGTCEDIVMWRATYRKLLGTMLARHMGNWFYDMAGGWFDHPEITADIRQTVALTRRLVARKPAAWRPEIAMVVDEARIMHGDDPLAHPNEMQSLVWTGGAPTSCYLAEDVLDCPERLDAAKVVVLLQFSAFDARRVAFLRKLAEKPRTLIFFADCGLAGGLEETGFVVREEFGRFSCKTAPSKSFRDMQFMISFSKTETSLDYRRNRRRLSVVETNGVCALSRYCDDGAIAVASRTDGRLRRVYVAEYGGLDPAHFLEIARQADAYLPVERPGLQIDMNGDFISVHALRNGCFDFRLPFPCCVRNLKTGVLERVEDDVLQLNVSAGETCWFALER